MAHRLITAYLAGRAAFPHTFTNPYGGTTYLAAARMWRLGWQKAGDESRRIPYLVVVGVGGGASDKPA
jgi:hypothetical protein